ncbi:type VII secretion-associated serine protease mycosin [Streptomyces sp. 12297]|uniref:type VII secretion-associated serine protease mycosin n=1 Tax=Streptomyces sp. NBC_00239 TaxID=2903640 RepID=UPI002E2A5931|nr:type VII secretion-associated serine protease mycosin [Streptomyces sp. NBC_00239]
MPKNPARRRPLLRTALPAALAAVAAVTPSAAPEAALAPAPFALAGSGACTFPMKKQTPGRPWALQRVLLDQLWQDTKGKGVRVAVIDTGVDRVNPQLRDAVDTAAGRDFLEAGKDGTDDRIGHGTKVAGVIAARPRAGTGFVGLAPEATIIPIRQNDERNSGNAKTMADAIDHAVARKADVINISQDTEQPLAPTSALAQAVRKAVAAGVVVVASAGNDGLDGEQKRTYPAAFDDVLAVASSDRNNERAAFSQSGDFVGVAAPGVDILSTVPGGGQCVDNGTSFSAPYAAGVAALLSAKHPDWTPRQIIAQIEQTAERSVNGRDRFVGWGVVDPVRALTEDRAPRESPEPDPGPPPAAAPEPAALAVGETPQERDERYATYALGIAAVLVAVISGTAVVLRDRRRRRTRTP